MNSIDDNRRECHMSESHFNAPAQVFEATLESGVKKAGLPLGRMILMGIMAGAFIALGGATSSTAVHSISDVGLARTLAGCIFPVGLMMIVIVGGELFTGDCLMVMGVMTGRFSWGRCIRTLCVVYLSNLIGACIVAALTVYSGNLDYSKGLLGAYTIKVALGKATIAPLKGIMSGILCNILVCMAVLMATASTDIAGKIWAIFFPILAFITGGFEHCVANMYYIPAGIMAAANPVYAEKAAEVYAISQEQLSLLTPFGMLNNLIPVTIGNILGGMLFVGVPFALIHMKHGKQ